MKATAVQILSTSEFESAVLSPPSAIAVFDCDGTLWAGDAGSDFMRWSVETGLMGREAAEWLHNRYQAYKRGDISEAVICGEMVQVYAGLRESEVRDAARQFFLLRVERNIFPEMQRIVGALHAAGTELWAVSSTNNWVIEEGAKRFGIEPERVLAAEVETLDGLVTGRLVDVPTDEAKAAALKRAGVHSPDIVFGNSIHDAAMLAMASRPFPVNPSPALVDRSIAEGWPVYYPESVRPRSATMS